MHVDAARMPLPITLLKQIDFKLHNGPGGVCGLHPTQHSTEVYPGRYENLHRIKTQTSELHIPTDTHQTLSTERTARATPERGSSAVRGKTLNIDFTTHNTGGGARTHTPCLFDVAREDPHSTQVESEKTCK